MKKRIRYGTYTMSKRAISICLIILLVISLFTINVSATETNSLEETTSTVTTPSSKDSSDKVGTEKETVASYTKPSTEAKEKISTKKSKIKTGASVEKVQTGDASGTCGTNLIWSFSTETGTLIISGTGTMNSYSTQSSNRAPWYSSFSNKMTNVVIEDGVENIGAYAFSNCTNLKSITIPDSVTSIGNGAFSNCTNLKSIIIPDSVGSIADTAFAGCNYIGSCGTGCVWIYNPSDTTLTIKGGGTMKSYSSANGSRAPWYTYSNSITDVFIEDGITNISTYAFYNCTALTNINIPDSITSIAATAFKGCSNVGVCGTNSIWTYNSYTTTLKISGTGKIDNVTWGSFASKITDLVIESGITNIGNMFSEYNYSNLENISVDENNETYYSIDGNLYQKAYNDFVYLVRYAPAKTDSEFVIPNNVYYISNWAFGNCESLSSITIPNSVSSIADYAFYNCISLESINIPNSIRSIGYGAFSQCKKLKDITIGTGIRDIKSGAFSDCFLLRKVNIEDLSSWCSITFDDEKANPLYYAKNLYLNDELITNLNVPNISTIKPYTFYSGQFNSVNLPESLNSIGNYAFKDCSFITNITIPDNVGTIGKYAFSNCKSLASVIIGNDSNLYSVGDYAFENCNLNNEPSFPSGCMLGNEVCKTNNINWQYNKTTGTLTINGNGSVKRGDWYSLYKDAMKSIIINEGITSIENNAFAGCIAVENISIPSTVNSIGDYAFYQCENLKNLVIPEGVEELGRSVCSWCTSLTSITIPESVKSIGSNSFYYCTNLEKIYISSISKWCNITFGGYDANPLYYAKNLYLNNELITNVSIPDDVENIKPYAFYNYKRLTDVIISANSSLTSIGDSAFENCITLDHRPDNIPNDCDVSPSAFNNCGFGEGTCGSYTTWTLNNGILTISGTGEIKSSRTYPWKNFAKSVKGIIVEDNVTEIPNNAFSDFELESVSLGENTQFSDIPFTRCDTSSLNTISISPDNTMYKKEGNAIIETSTNKLILGCENTIIPNDVVEIADYAFYNCTSLESITIPDNVETIGQEAFTNCTSLETVNIGNNSSVTSIGYGAFSNCTSLINITIPNNVYIIRGSTYQNCNSLAEITIPENVRTIEISAFADCSSLTRLTIPSKVASINQSAFEGCNSLQTINVDANNTTYDSRNNCNAIINTSTNKLIFGCKNTTIPNTVTSIGYISFKGSSIESITIPDSVEEIESCAFKDCSSLSTVNINTNNNIDTIWYATFEGCTSLVNIDIPNNVTNINECAFKDCTSLSNINIPDSVESIGIYAFENCDSLNSIDINSNSDLDSIGYAAFRNCSSLVSINIPDNVKSIGQEAFRNCTALLSIIISESTTEISDYTFQSCASLQSVIVGNGVSKIGKYAFGGCKKANIVVSDNVTTIDSNAFSNSNMIICPITSYTYDLLTSNHFLDFRSDETTTVGIVTAKYKLNQILRAKNTTTSIATSSKNIKYSTKSKHSKKNKTSGNNIVENQFIEQIIKEDLSNVECYVVEDLVFDKTLTFDSNLHVTLHLNDIKTDNKGNVVLDSSGNIEDGQAHTISGSNDKPLIEVPGNLTITTNKESSGGIINDNGDLFDVKNNGNLKIENGTYSEDVSEYIANDKVISKTNNRYTVVNPTTKDLSLEDDGHEMIMPNNQNTFSRNEFLGVQIRRASERNYFNEGDLSIHTVAVEEAMRFVSVIRTDILRGAEDYGYVLVKGRNYDNMKSRQNDIYSGSDGCVTVSLKGTKNTLANTPYSSKNLDEGKYKYLTAAVHHIDDENTAIGARFYIKRLDGTYVYSDYTCVSTMGKLKAMAT